MLIGHPDYEGGGSSTVLFEIGDVVRHKLYGYRGVIVSFDPVCMAGDKWYYANKTQPTRQQPWFHVLVHDSGGLSTYVAQSNLDHDESRKPINHPRIGAYFSGFKDGRYRVNDGQSGGCAI